MKDSVQEVRDTISSLKATIASLKAQEEGRRGIHRQLEEAQKQLAYLTASAFVAIDSGKEVVVYGVASELMTKAGRLCLSLGKGSVVNVRVSFDGGSMTFYLMAGGRISFSLDEEFCEGGARTYHVHAFATSDEAESWAERRRSENTSR